jgi:hypothetical protein
MKRLLFIPLVLLSFIAGATREVVVEAASVTTAPGIGGDAQIAYAFAKGDVVTIDAKASKMLDRMVVVMQPGTQLGKHAHTKSPHVTFTMPEDGIVVIGFISDKPGTNDVAYTVKRLPATEASQNYNTAIIWKVPENGKGARYAVRSGQ